MSAPFVRSAYNYDVMAASDESALECKDLSLAVQESREECDINYIVRQFGLTGKLPDNVRLPQYGDFNGISDFREALEAVGAAEASFMQLPGEMRARFHNDPQAFLEFCSSEGNRAEMLKMGLLKAELTPPPVVEVKPAV